MVRVTLEDSNGQRVEIDEGESANIEATFEDLSGDALDKSSLATLTCTLLNAADGAVINSRSNQNILDANGSTVTTAGVLTLRLEPDDNAIVNTNLSSGQTESHYLTVTWTWSDGTATRTGKQEWELLVRKTSQADEDSTVGWLG